MKNIHIYGICTGENVVSLDLILLNSGVHPGYPIRRMLPFGYRSNIKMPDGTTISGVPSPFIAWYIEGTKEKILVDTGLSSEAPKEIEKILPSYGDKSSGLYRKGPEHDIVRSLAKIGVTPKDIDIVLLTHLHWDHFCNAEIFKNATFIVQRDEIPLALVPTPSAVFYYREFAHHLLAVMERVQAIEGDLKITKGVEVWKVGGHTPGSQAVVVETNKGLVALAGDLVYNYKNIEFDWPMKAIWNFDQWARSLNILKREVDIIVPGHDYYFWQLFPEGRIG